MTLLAVLVIVALVILMLNRGQTVSVGRIVVQVVKILLALLILKFALAILAMVLLWIGFYPILHLLDTLTL